MQRTCAFRTASGRLLRPMERTGRMIVPTQPVLGLDGNPGEILRARLFLREWSGGKIRLEPWPDTPLVAAKALACS